MRAERVASDVFRLKTLMVNVYFARDRTSGQWALIDTGLPGYTQTIRRVGEQLFGTTPAAILLTHGHFDHVSGLPMLAEEGGAPASAPPLELPYLTGRSKYPPPDPTVGGGAQSWISLLL